RQINARFPSTVDGTGGKGSLAVDSDADIVVYPINPGRVDISREPEKFEKALGNPTLLVKDGVVVLKNGILDQGHRGHLYWTSGKPDEAELKAVKTIKDRLYQKYFSTTWNAVGVAPAPELVELK
ncbi:MAG: hypothetical protein ACTSU5_12860, partial [Promethearchaeota archaeon]